MGMADGCIARVCTGRVSLVPAVAAAVPIAVPALNLDGAAHGLDGQYFANVRSLALAIARICVAAPTLGLAGGIWVRRNSGCDRVASSWSRPGVRRATNSSDLTFP